jgi:hypothetical protein
MNCAACSRAFPQRANVVLVDGKIYHLRCESRGQKRLSAKRSRVAQERTTRRARKALDVDSVFARDRGVCAMCKLDTTRIKPWLESLPSAFEAMCNGSLTLGAMDRFAAAVNNGTTLGRHRSRALVLLARLWGVVLTHGAHFAEVDHIVPISEGGGDELANLRTLCRRCHARVTAELKGRLARRPTKAVGRGF